MNKLTLGSLNLKVPWGHIAAKTWGNPMNSRMLVAHGMMDNAGSFDRLIAQLPENFYYVCIDFPGHGWSSHFPSGLNLSYFSYVLAIKYVLDELKWDQVHYMGHSFGAHTGVLFSVIYPNRIKKLILLDCVVSRSLSSKETIAQIKYEHDLAIEESKSYSPRLYTKEEVIYALSNLRLCSLNTDAVERLFERAVTKVNDKYCYNRDIRLRSSINAHFDVSKADYIVTQISAPTLVIFSSSTLPILVPTTKRIKELLKNKSNITIVDVQGNHDVHNNYPERISGHINQFLNMVHNKL